jgi:hypothetical protein
VLLVYEVSLVSLDLLAALEQLEILVLLVEMDLLVAQEVLELLDPQVEQVQLGPLV